MSHGTIVEKPLPHGRAPLLLLGLLLLGGCPSRGGGEEVKREPEGKPGRGAHALFRPMEDPRPGDWLAFNRE